MTDDEIRTAAWNELLTGAESAAEDWVDEDGDYPSVSRSRMRTEQYAHLDTLRKQGPLMRARQGIYPYWQHACGHIEAFVESGPDTGGCDACESGSDDVTDWKPVYVQAETPLAVC